MSGCPPSTRKSTTCIALPLNEFTGARNALAKSLSGDEAKRVRALAKPTLVPWAVNQVYWHARATYDRLMKSGERCARRRSPRSKDDRADVRAAGEAHRRAIAEAVAEAERLAESAGRETGRRRAGAHVRSRCRSPPSGLRRRAG